MELYASHLMTGKGESNNRRQQDPSKHQLCVSDVSSQRLTHELPILSLRNGILVRVGRNPH